MLGWLAHEGGKVDLESAQDRDGLTSARVIGCAATRAAVSPFESVVWRPPTWVEPNFRKQPLSIL
jgi:hypothetical protein